MKKFFSVLCFVLGAFLLLLTIAMFGINEIGGGIFMLIVTLAAVFGGIFLLKSSKTISTNNSDYLSAKEFHPQNTQKVTSTKKQVVSQNTSTAPTKQRKARSLYIKDPQKTQVILYDKYIYYKREGAMNLMTRGMQGEKKVPYRNITSIQFKPATGITNGYIQFSIMGSAESKRGLQAAVYDENSIMFSKKYTREAEYIKNFVEGKILHENDSPNELEKIPAAHPDKKITPESLPQNLTINSTKFDKAYEYGNVLLSEFTSDDFPVLSVAKIKKMEDKIFLERHHLLLPFSEQCPRYKMVNDFLTKGDPVFCQVYSCSSKTYGYLTFYKEKPQVSKHKNLEFKVSNSGGKVAQDNIHSLTVGDELYFYEDDEKEKIFISNMTCVFDNEDYIGSVPNEYYKYILNQITINSKITATVKDLVKKPNNKIDVYIDIRIN